VTVGQVEGIELNAPGDGAWSRLERDQTDWSQCNRQIPAYRKSKH
jgi:hypothetical protein